MLPPRRDRMNKMGAVKGDQGFVVGTWGVESGGEARHWTIGSECRVDASLRVPRQTVVLLSRRRASDAAVVERPFRRSCRGCLQ
jgi:hypothetical protein